MVDQSASWQRERVQAETKYARLGQDRIAYQALGQGPPDLVFTMGTF
jgi:hypothetical protein